MLTALICVLPAGRTLILATPPTDSKTPPPGLVAIEGGPTRVGSTVEYVESVVQRDPTLFDNIACETPQHVVDVADFHLMVSEVTNEQFAAFVQASGSRPPQHWGEAAIDRASAEYVLDLGRRAEEARRAGRPVPDSVKFDREAWWREHWRSQPWSVPHGKEASPVVYVDFADARAYARWAGLRLMSEAEFQRAGRGRTGSLYPWGDDASVPTRAVTQELQIAGKAVRPAEPFPVGSLQSGRTQQGVCDLIGNVWEWTTTSFTPYPGYKDLKLSVGAGSKERTLEALPPWDDTQLVAVGGCFQQSLFVARLTTRRDAGRSQSTDSLGFRCAATPARGLDLAEATLREDLAAVPLPAGTRFDAAKVALADRWESRPGSARAVLETGAESEPLPGYAVITSYEFAMFVPALDLDASTVTELRELARRRGPLPLGVLAVSRPVAEPALDRGTYVVSFRAAGTLAAPTSGGVKNGANRSRARQDADRTRSEAFLRPPSDLDLETDALVFYSPGGEPRAWMRAPEFEYRRPLAPEISIAPAIRDYVVEKPGGVRERSAEPAVALTMGVSAWVRVPGKGVSFTLELLFQPNDVGPGWRTR